MFGNSGTQIEITDYENRKSANPANVAYSFNGRYVVPICHVFQNICFYISIHISITIYDSKT